MSKSSPASGVCARSTRNKRASRRCLNRWWAAALFATFFGLFSGNANAEPHGPTTLALEVDVDKTLHVSVSYGLTLSSTLVLRKLEVPRWAAVVAASAATLALGTLKELAIDDEYSWPDQGANTIGVAASALFVFILEL